MSVLTKARKEAVISLLTWERKYLGKSFKISNNIPGVKELEDRLLSILSMRVFKAYSLWHGSHSELWISFSRVSCYIG